MKILREATKEDLDKFLKNIDLTDKQLYESINNDQNFVFQFSGGTASDMINRSHPECFEEAIAINCLSRPGSSFQFDDYVNNGRDHSKYPEFIAKFLKDTHGCIITQEEIMAISTECGLDSNEVRGLLKKLGKAVKKPEDLKRWSEIVKQFEKAFKEKGMSESEIKMVLDDFVKLSAYSFNKSHAAAYSYLAMETVYLSNYFKPYFYSANLAFQADSTDGLKTSIKEAKKKGFNILPPNVNNSDLHFFPKGKDLFFGLNDIKGVGLEPAKTVIKNRPYNSIIDFITKNLEEKTINKRVVTALIGSGAFDDLIPEKNRKKYLNIVEDFYEKKKTKKSAALLEAMWNSVEEDHILDCKTTNDEFIEYEKKYLGDNFFHSVFSEEILKKIDYLIETRNIARNFEDLKDSGKPSDYVAVFLKSYRYHTQKNGEEMIFITCQDLNGTEASIPVFASYWKYCKIKFAGEGFYLLSLYDKEGQVMFGSKSWIKSPDSIRRLMGKFKTE